MGRLLLRPAATPVGGSRLQQAAAGMSPGQWLEFDTWRADNAGTMDVVPPSNEPPFYDDNTQVDRGTSTEYCDKVLWDPIHKRIIHIGSGHTGAGSHPSVCTWYDEATDAWFRIDVPNASNHTYDTYAVDRLTGRLFFAWGQSAQVWSTPYAETYSQSTWPTHSSLTSVHSGGWHGFLENFPERNCLYAVRTPVRQVVECNLSGTTWTGIATDNTYFLSQYHVARYSKLHQCVYFTGEANSFWKVDINGTVTRLTDIPFPLGTSDGSAGLSAVDPLTGNFLAFGQDSSVKDFRQFNGSTWQQMNAATRAAIPFFGYGQLLSGTYDTIGVCLGTIEEYGVIVLVFGRYEFLQRCVLYRHDASAV